MNDNDDIPPPAPKIGAITRLLIWLAGGDVDTTRRCPPRDLEVLRVLALIMIATAAYQIAVFSLIGHRIFAADGGVRPSIILVAALIALFVMLIDSFTFMRAGWISAGEKDLARAGLDLRGGWTDRAKAGVMVVVRLSLAIALAQLLGILLGLAVFASDIEIRINGRFLEANGPILGKVSILIDGEIKRGEANVAAKDARAADLAGSVKALRDSLGDPSNSPAVQTLQRGLERAEAAKAKADEEQRSAEALAADELSGTKGRGLSGRPGRGPQRRAAEERLKSSGARAVAADAELQASRDRLTAARAGAVSANEATRARATSELPHLEAELAAEDRKLTEARDQLAGLVAGRGQAIRHAIESTPEHVPYDNGLIAQIKALEAITGDDRQIQALILLIGLVGFGFELAGVLAKLTTHVPTTFAALTVRDHYLDTVRIVDELADEMDRRDQKRSPPLSLKDQDLASAPRPSNDDNPFEAMIPSERAEVENDHKPAEPGKRPRGRPRKQMLN